MPWTTVYNVQRADNGTSGMSMTRHGAVDALAHTLFSQPEGPAEWTDLAELWTSNRATDAWTTMDASEKVHEHGEFKNVEYASPGRTTWPVMGVTRRVRVKGREGVGATVVATVVHDTVWLSISPPFTWEAIMEPAAVDAVISMLEKARDEAKAVATACNRSAFREGRVVARAITRDGSATQ